MRDGRREREREREGGDDSFAAVGRGRGGRFHGAGAGRGRGREQRQSLVLTVIGFLQTHWRGRAGPLFDLAPPDSLSRIFSVATQKAKVRRFHVTVPVTATARSFGGGERLRPSRPSLARVLREACLRPPAPVHRNPPLLPTHSSRRRDGNKER